MGSPLDDLDDDFPPFADATIPTGDSAPSPIAASEKPLTNDEVGFVNAVLGSPVFQRHGNANRDRDVLYVDIETVPDISRASLYPFQPPEQVELTPILMLRSVAEVAGWTVENIAKYIATVTPDTDWWLLLKAEEAKREKGPRKEVEKLIAQGLDVHNAFSRAMADYIKALSLNPLTLKIISIGWQVGSNGSYQNRLAADFTEERKLVSEFLSVAAHHRPVIGFNVREFDLRSILVRASILGVEVPRMFNMSRYNQSDVLDLADVLFPGGAPPKGWGMKAVARSLGIEVPADHGDGSQVYGLYINDDWAAISKYQAGDVALTIAIHQKLSGKLCQ